MSKRKFKSLEKRQREFEMLKPFSYWVLQFNDCLHIRLCASNGEIIEYHPISEKFGTKGGKMFRSGYGDLINYLESVS